MQYVRRSGYCIQKGINQRYLLQIPGSLAEAHHLDHLMSPEELGTCCHFPGSTAHKPRMTANF